MDPSALTISSALVRLAVRSPTTTASATGAWLLVSPWPLGFSASTALMWNAVIVGALVALLAAWTLYDVVQDPKPLAR